MVMVLAGHKLQKDIIWTVQTENRSQKQKIATQIPSQYSQMINLKNKIITWDGTG